MLSIIPETVVNTARYATLLARYGFKPDGRHRPRLNPTQTHTVMVLPGFLGPRSVTRPLQMYLEDRSMPSFGFNLGMYSALPMETVLKALMHRISQVRRSAPWIRRFDLVGHSMGGVLSAQAIKRGALDGLKTRFVGLGAPFRGTYAALVSLLIPGAFDLLPIHSRYRDLIGQTWLEQTLFLSIAGGFDVLAPPDRCHHPLAKNIVFHDVDHAGLLVREDVFAAVYDFLARPI